MGVHSCRSFPSAALRAGAALRTTTRLPTGHARPITPVRAPTPLAAYVSALHVRRDARDAGGRMRVFSRVCPVPRRASAKRGRLLRILLVRQSEVSVHATGRKRLLPARLNGS